ncbi:UDP-glucuronic acid decarboxylase family protein [Fimbriimonas ginsengisoli]|uniref:UDP-glucuronate decarboxylase n=1 Tax=Fimbriimonas ginsengisoli Gsoil 348 TaxID=661478 RepID=A0A068NLG7_FIMGI|nr:UDP-glucuronic acid decarboxylase family protein [Fimbriimonas ginsengisoli]AIE84326.1 NAD-dependent epimerase/dehydratase [Fimbriimonas ginsengisoli Gsoil 348]
MRAVVTGGAGFLGSHLVDRLLKEGWDHIVVLDNLITGSTDNIAHLAGDGRVRFIKHNVSDYIYVDGPVDFVFHFASPASPDDFKKHPIPVLKVGSLGTHNALGLAKAKGAKFMLASTSEVYGDPLISPQPETYWGNVNPVGPRAVYDEAKRFAEAMTMAYRHFHNVDTRIVRFFNTYGPRMRLDDGRVVPNFVKQALLGEPITVYGDGSQTRSFGYYEDTIDGVYRLASSDYHEPVNIGTEEERTILQFAKEVIAVTGSKSEIVHVPAAQDDPKQRRPDLTRARTILGYEYKTSLTDGLTKTVEYFQGRLGAERGTGF